LFGNARKGQSMGASILLGLLVILGVAGLVAYVATVRSSLVQLRRESEKAWADLDPLLKQRSDELPKLVGICRGYMQAEQRTLQSVAEGRAAFLQATTVADKARADRLISEALKTLFAAAENSPDLKANTSFRQLRGCITALDERIAAQRRRFNARVHAFNARLAQVPAKLMAAFLHLQPQAPFEANESERAGGPVKFT
jgi:LemA protein